MKNFEAISSLNFLSENLKSTTKYNPSIKTSQAKHVYSFILERRKKHKTITEYKKLLEEHRKEEYRSHHLHLIKSHRSSIDVRGGEVSRSINGFLGLAAAYNYMGLLVTDSAS